MPSKVGGGKEQRENSNAIKKAYHIDKEQPKGMTLNPWSHAPAEDTKRPTKQPSNRRKTTKEEKTLFKGAYMSFTTDKSRVIRGLTVQQVACTSTCGLYH